MEVNLTCVVQIFNFLVFCVCAKRLFLRPFVCYIQEQVAAHERIDADFAAKEAKLKDLIHTRGVLQDQFRVMLRKKYQINRVSHDHEQVVECVPAEFSPQEKETLRCEAVEYVTIRIKNAYRT